MQGYLFLVERVWPAVSGSVWNGDMDKFNELGQACACYANSEREFTSNCSAAAKNWPCSQTHSIYGRVLRKKYGEMDGTLCSVLHPKLSWDIFGRSGPTHAEQSHASVIAHPWSIFVWRCWKIRSTASFLSGHQSYCSQ
jgi:hypothetical protein